jgi:hypothetical protein
MNTASYIQQQAKDFANLTTDSNKKAFLNAQKEAFSLLSPEEKLEHFKAIQQRTEELKNRMQNIHLHSFNLFSKKTSQHLGGFFIPHQNIKSVKIKLKYFIKSLN